MITDDDNVQDENLVKPLPQTPDFEERKKQAAEKAAEVDLRPEKRSWEPVDVSTGIYRGKDLFVPRHLFEQHLREDLKDVLPKFSQRNLFAKTLSSKRKDKITKSEMRGIIKDLEDTKKISHLKARQLRKKFGVRGSSF